jgi:exonuclease III
MHTVQPTCCTHPNLSLATLNVNSIKGSSMKLRALQEMGQEFQLDILGIQETNIQEKEA